MKTDLKKVDVRLAVVDEPPLNPEEPVYIKCSEVNPKHKEKTASCAVFFNHIHCFSCGFHIAGRMESLAAVLKIPLNKAFKYARRYTSEGLDAYRERAAIEARKDPLPSALAEGYKHILWSAGQRRERISWFMDRGINAWWVNHAVLGHDGEKFCIPIFDAEKRLLNIRFRRDDLYYIAPEEGERDRPKYSGMRGRNGTYFYPEWLFAGDDRDWAVVCEGELDALRLWVEDIPAISPTNGASSVKQVVEFLSLYPRIKRVYICTDQDAAGDKAADEFLSLSRGQFDYTARLIWSSEYKDITEFIQATGDLPVALRKEQTHVSFDETHTEHTNGLQIAY